MSNVEFIFVVIHCFIYFSIVFDTFTNVLYINMSVIRHNLLVIRISFLVIQHESLYNILRIKIKNTKKNIKRIEVYNFKH